MKIRLLLLLTSLLVIISNSSFSQYNLKELQRRFAESGLFSMPYSNSYGEKGISLFEYGEDGLLNKSIWRLADNSRSSVNSYKYDLNGNMIEKYREFSDSITSIETFEYDSENHLLSENFVRSDGFTCNASYEYDNSGRVVKAWWQNYHGWFNGEISFSYSEGLLSEGKIIEDGIQTGFINFKYDNNSRLTEEYWEFSGKYNQIFAFEYKDTNKGFTSSNVFITNTYGYRIVNEEYDFNQELRGRSVYYYSDGAKLERKVYKVNDKIKTNTTYEYDSDGLLLNSLRVFDNGTETLIKYTFNKDRQLTDRVYYQNDSITGSEHYDYKMGTLTGGQYVNFDTWLTGTLTFETDSKGKINEGIFKGKDGFDAEIYFDYDNLSNITRIHWVFSFGKTQTYYFEYEENR